MLPRLSLTEPPIHSLFALLDPESPLHMLMFTHRAFYRISVAIAISMQPTQGRLIAYPALNDRSACL